MADTEDKSPAPSSSTKPRISYACEACRVAKVKCQPGSVEGICRRCSDSKRECIFKLGPRTRRRRSRLHPAATRSTPPPSAPSKTFVIDVPMPAEEATNEPADMVQLHEVMIQNLVVDAEDSPGESSNPLVTNTPSSASGSRAFSNSTPSTGSHYVHGFSSLQPQFNLDSAASLLGSFRDFMLPYFPVITLSSEATVPSLAKERPFVLLAILAAASGTKSLQGHNLYDEEFRKVLGLKFVSGGERSLELLVGLLIYCAWYPFHLRPKKKQALQYIRMASDIVHDLDLNQPQDDINRAERRTSPERIDSIRAYLGAQCLDSGFAATWQKTHTLPFKSWTATCCDILVNNDGALTTKSDQTLSWLARLQNFIAEAAQIHNHGGQEQQEGQHRLLMLRGMEAQLGEFQGQMPPEILSQPILHMTNLMTNIFLCGSPLLRFPYERAPKRNHSYSVTYADPDRLLRCATLLRTWYDYILSLPASEFSHFPGTLWGQLVASIILGLRLSFPIPSGCPDWDHAAARRVLDFGTFLVQFSCGDGSVLANLAPASSRGSTSTDVLSASRVVVDMVRRKYEKRLATLELSDAMQVPPHPGLSDSDKSVNGCPMLDGSLDQFIRDWDERLLDPTSWISPIQGFSGPDTGSGKTTSAMGSQPAPFHDLWATMTMGWSQEGFQNVDFNNI